MKFTNISIFIKLLEQLEEANSWDDGPEDVITRDPVIGTTSAAEKEPESKKWLVMLHNSDYVEGLSVAQALSDVFGITSDAALRIMMAAHRQGSAVVISYGSKDVAETKAARANKNLEFAANTRDHRKGEYAEVFQVVSDD